MENIKIAYRIIAVRERQDLVTDLLAKLGEPESSVFSDEEHKGCMWNAIRLWKSYESLPEGTTHMCLLADDAEVVKDFKEAVHKCVENFPDCIWTFANYPQIKGSDRGKFTPYIKIWNHQVRGICYLMPVKLIKGWLDFYEKYLSGVKGWNHDQVTTSLYALLNDIDVMMPIPNLVVGKDVLSVIKGHKRLNRNRDMSCWFGRDIDLRQFNTCEFVTSKSRSMFEFHLWNDEEVLVLAKQKIAKMKKIDRLLNG